MEALVRWLLRHPKKILTAFVVLSVLFALEIRNLKIDPSISVALKTGSNPLSSGRFIDSIIKGRSVFSV